MPAHVTIKLTMNEAQALAVALPKALTYAPAEAFDDATGKALGRVFDKAHRAIFGRHGLFCAACKGHGRDVPGPGNQNFGCPKCGLTKGDVA
jgi:hypothetical protein